MMDITDVKVRGMYVFSQDYKYRYGDFFDRVDLLNKGLAETANREKAKNYIKEFREKFKNPDNADDVVKKKTWKQILRHELSPYYQILKWYFKKQENYVESTGITVDYRPPRILLRDHYYNKVYTKAANKFPYYPFDKVGKFVYFPLQFQPEAQIDVVAPFFSNQIETARQTAMSLPGDYTLVVKEHPAMVGLRPPSYWEKIARTVNVKFIDYRISGEEVLKRADLVISPNSTTLAEAAFLKKPAIQLGDLGITLKLPNVFKHSDMTTMSSKIKELLMADLNNADYERKLENFVASAYDTGFNLQYIQMWEEGKGNVEELWPIYKKEIEHIFS